MRTQLLRPILLALLLIPLTACESTGPDATLIGDYTLLTVDGIAMPWTMDENETFRVRVMSGNINLSGDGSFLDHTVYEIAEGDSTRVESVDYNGTFTKISAGATMTYDGLGSLDVQIAGGKLTQLVGESSWVYQR